MRFASMSRRIRGLPLPDRRLGAVPPREVRADQPPDQDEEAEQEAAADPERRDEASRRRPGAFVAHGEKRPLFRPHRGDEGPDLLHRRATGARADVSPGLLRAPGLREAYREVELAEPLGHELLEHSGPLALGRVVGRHRADPPEALGHLRGRAPVRLEIGVLARDEEAPLPGLGLRDRGLDALEPGEHVLGVVHPARFPDELRRVHPGHGDEHQERAERHGDGDREANVHAPRPPAEPAARRVGVHRVAEESAPPRGRLTRRLSSQPSTFTVTRLALSSPVCSVSLTREPTTTPASMAATVSFASRAERVHLLLGRHDFDLLARLVDRDRADDRLDLPLHRAAGGVGLRLGLRLEGVAGAGRLRRRLDLALRGLRRRLGLALLGAGRFRARDGSREARAAERAEQEISRDRHGSSPPGRHSRAVPCTSFRRVVSGHGATATQKRLGQLKNLQTLPRNREGSDHLLSGVGIAMPGPWAKSSNGASHR